MSDRAEAIEKLAERLHWYTEKVDPAAVTEEWSLLEESERAYYRGAVEDLLDFRELILSAVSAD